MTIEARLARATTGMIRTPIVKASPRIPGKSGAPPSNATPRSGQLPIAFAPPASSIDATASQATGRHLGESRRPFGKRSRVKLMRSM